MAGIAIIIILVASFAFKKKPDSGGVIPGPTENTTSTVPVTGGGTSGTPGGTTSGTKPPPKPATPPPAPAPVSSSIKLLSPAQGDAWAMNKSHTIAWSKGAGATGSIELINASTGETAGFISANVGVSQNFYPWDTRDLALSRADSSKKSLAPGSYKVKIVFDKNLAPIESAVFSVVGENGTESVTTLSRIQDKKITPQNISVSRGAKIIYMNNDTVKHQISGNGLTSFDINPGAAYTLDTSVLASGTYYAYSNIYTYLAPITLTIK